MSAVPLLEVEDLSVHFRARRRSQVVRAVDGVSLRLMQGETLAIVGESGSGKSTLARAVLGLDRATSGTIRLSGRDITHLRPRARRVLGRQLQAVFQDPNASLSPSYTVGRSVAEPLSVGPRLDREATARSVRAMLDEVGLDVSAEGRLPAEFSGGQRQRISIARALIPSPQLVICDEAVSALDLSVQAQVLNLLRRLQHQHGVSYLFITHDLAVMRHLAQRVLVLYRGQVMESGSAVAVSSAPAHPYTRALIDAAPLADPVAQRLRRDAVVAAPSTEQASRRSAGCPFAPRCPYAQERCWADRPALQNAGDGRRVACHRYPEWQALAARPPTVTPAPAGSVPGSAPARTATDPNPTTARTRT